MRSKKNKLIILLVLIVAVICGSFVGAFFALTQDLPQIRSLENFKPDAVTRIYSADKILLAELFLEKREPVPLEAIPRYLTAAIVATEDRKFYQHSGVDIKGIARAIIKDIRAGRFVEGASTITQQLAKNLYFTPDRSFLRKLNEAVVAKRLELFLSKERILEIYLNVAEFGPGVFGAEAAAQTFFRSSAVDLGRHESALLAAVLPSPARLSAAEPSRYVRERASWIMRQIEQLGGRTYLDGM